MNECFVLVCAYLATALICMNHNLEMGNGIGWCIAWTLRIKLAVNSLIIAHKIILTLKLALKRSRNRMKAKLKKRKNKLMQRIKRENEGIEHHQREIFCKMSHERASEEIKL